MLFMTLKGFETFITQNSPLNMTSFEQEGGAITSFHSEIGIHDHVRLENNYARNGGAVLAIKSKIHMFRWTSLASNQATGNGGGIYLHQSELQCFKQSVLTLIGNQACEGGGGIYAFSSILKAEYYYDFTHHIHNCILGPLLTSFKTVPNRVVESSFKLMHKFTL